MQFVTTWVFSDRSRSPIYRRKIDPCLKRRSLYILSMLAHRVYFHIQKDGTSERPDQKSMKSDKLAIFRKATFFAYSKVI